MIEVDLHRDIIEVTSTFEILTLMSRAKQKFLTSVSPFLTMLWKWFLDSLLGSGEISIEDTVYRCAAGWFILSLIYLIRLLTLDRGTYIFKVPPVYTTENSQDG